MQPPEGSGALVGAAQEVPPLPDRGRDKLPADPNSGKEERQIDLDGRQSHNIRRVAGYGALVIAAVLYVAGLYAAYELLRNAHVAYLWHVALAILIPLFTVPTVLMIAVLRAVAAKPHSDDNMPTSMAEALGRLIEKALERLGGSK